MDIVLIIEDEQALRSSMAKAISKIADIGVVEAGDLNEGLRLIDINLPFLILSDINLPGRKGIEILGELENRNLNIPVVFMTAFMQTYANKVPKIPNVEIREKPILLTDLRELVNSKRSAMPLETKLPFTIADYIQITCIGKYSVEILVRLNETYYGSIIIIEGFIWSAQDKKGIGIEAFNRLLQLQDYQISCINIIKTPESRNITGDWEKLILMALIQEGDIEGINKVDNIVSKEDIFKIKIEEVNNFLLDKNYEQALKILMELKKLNAEDPNVNAKLSRLKELGFSTVKSQSEVIEPEVKS